MRRRNFLYESISDLVNYRAFTDRLMKFSKENDLEGIHFQRMDWQDTGYKTQVELHSGFYFDDLFEYEAMQDDSGLIIRDTSGNASFDDIRVKFGTQEFEDIAKVLEELMASKAGERKQDHSILDQQEKDGEYFKVAGMEVPEKFIMRSKNKTKTFADLKAAKQWLKKYLDIDAVRWDLYDASVYIEVGKLEDGRPVSLVIDGRGRKVARAGDRKKWCMGTYMNGYEEEDVDLRSAPSGFIAEAGQNGPYVEPRRKDEFGLFESTLR